jgi:hypothetical protein
MVCSWIRQEHAHVCIRLPQFFLLLTFNRSSVIESFLGEDISQMFGGETAWNSIPMAFFYCARDPVEPKRADPVEIMNRILEQLASPSNGRPFLEPVTVRYATRKNWAENEPPESLELNESVQTILELHEDNPATIVIDALDECDPQDQQLLLRQLDYLIQKSTRLLKIFVSSRDDQDIVNYLENSPNIYISTRDNWEDIERYVGSQINIAIEQGSLLGGDVPLMLKEDIIESLISQANGMLVVAFNTA